jgi:hypothetical protein
MSPRSRPSRLAVPLAFAVLAAAHAGAAEAATPGAKRATPQDQADLEVLRHSVGQYTAVERAEVAKLSAAIDGLSSDKAILAAFKARDRAALLELARPKFEVLTRKQGITHWYFLDPPPARTCFLRVHKPEQFGDVVSRDTFSAAIKTGRIGSGKELGKTAFALRVVKPIREGGKIVGYMELGEEIGHFILRMKDQTGDDYGIFAHKEKLDRKELARVQKEDRWDERKDMVLIDSTMWNEHLVPLDVQVENIPEGGVLLGRWQDGSRTFVAGAFPVRDAGGAAVGAIVVRHVAAKL